MLYKTYLRLRDDFLQGRIFPNEHVVQFWLKYVDIWKRYSKKSKGVLIL